MSRAALYQIVNFCFLLLMAAGTALHPKTNVHPLYLIPLFALCSSAMFGLQRFNDRYALLAIFSGVYFLMFGMDDVTVLFTGEAGDVAQNSLISKTELVILAGAVCAVLGYRLAAGLVARSPSREARDWREAAVWTVGLILWIVFTALSWEYKVHVVADTTFEASAKGLGSLNALQKALFMVANTLQPLSILIIAFAQCRFRRSYALPIVVGVVLVQLVFGFVIDVKGDALIGVAIVIFTKIMVDAKLPKGWMLTSLVFVTLAFPVLQANRYVRGHYGFDHGYAAQNLGDILSRSIEATSVVASGKTRASNFVERLTLKGPLDMIVSRTGVDVEFQHGYTLVPLLLTFVPRLILPDKPDVQTGQLVNAEFHVTDNAYTYISPSHLGELYWNFGWPGVIIGMTFIGALLGYIGARFNLAESATLTRLMVMVITIQMLVVSFESTIAAQYSLWMRAMLAVGVLHLVFARRSVAAAPAATAPGSSPAPLGAPLLRFPNLLR